MKTIILFFLLILSAPLFAGDIVELTDDTFESYTRNKPAVFLIFIIDCELAQGLKDEFADTVAGIDNMQPVFMYYDKAEQTLWDMDRGGITAVYFIHYGEQKSVLDPAIGQNVTRRWVLETMDAYGIDTGVSLPPPERVEPERLTGSVDLERGLANAHNFDNGSLASPVDPDYEMILMYGINEDEALVNDLFTMDGRMAYGYNAKIIPLEEDLTAGYTLAFNFSYIPEYLGRESSYNLIMSLKTNILDLMIMDNKLQIHFDCKPYYGRWVYILEERDIKGDYWHHLILSFNEEGNRFHVFLNGERLDDIVLSAQAAREIAEMLSLNQIDWEDGQSEYVWTEIGFANESYARYFNGSLDDFRLYNRVLNDAEMEQLYREEHREGPLHPEYNNGVYVYNEINYKGREVRLEEGVYFTRDLESLGIRDDDISSVRCDGYEVTVFGFDGCDTENSLYGTLSENISDLGGFLYGSDDWISSLIVKKPDGGTEQQEEREEREQQQERQRRPPPLPMSDGDYMF